MSRAPSAISGLSAAAATAATAAPAAARLAGIRRLAWIVFGLSLVVVVVSAWLRLNAAGLGCADWPACYGQALAGAPAVPAAVARGLHRLAASTALILAGLLVWRARRWPSLPAARPAAALVAVMLLLSVVGIWSADPHRVAVNFINILGGLALVSLSWRVVMSTTPPASEAPDSALLPRAGLAALTLTVLLGTLIGARYAAVSCASLPFCDGVVWPSADGWAALDPLAVIVAAAPAGDAGGVALHLLHRYAAVATVLLLGLAALRGWRLAARRRAARAVLLLLAAEATLGVATVAVGFPLWLAVAHGVGAAGLLAAAASLFRRG